MIDGVSVSGIEGCLLNGSNKILCIYILFVLSYCLLSIAFVLFFFEKNELSDRR